MKPICLYNLIIGLLLTSGCAVQNQSSQFSRGTMQDNAAGVCVIDHGKPQAMSKKACFAQKGLFEETDNAEQIIARYLPRKPVEAIRTQNARMPAVANTGNTIPPAEVVAPAPAKITEKPTEAKAVIESAKTEVKVNCYLKGSDKPFQMAESICLEGGGSIR